MKELDQFTVEQLWKYANPEALTFPPSHAQVAALARIALAAKRATPSYWITYYPNPDPNEFDDREHSHSGAKSCAVRIAAEIGGFVVPVYHGISPLNSPENQDGWVAYKDRMPREGDYVIVAPDGGVTQCVTYFWEDCPINGKPMWFTHSEECEPVPLAEFTHWQPLPTAPKPEK